MCSRLVLFIFFFQAEDGIRDLVRSRGLGDVYKRQTNTSVGVASYLWNFGDGQTSTLTSPSHTYATGGAVSYTHLTLATSDLV